MDMLWEGLDEDGIRTAPTSQSRTIAWNIRHITRIEDLVANLLIADRKPVPAKAWLQRVGSSVTDCGNALSKAEIVEFSRNISMEGLAAYRRAVAEGAREVIRSLVPADLRRKPRAESVRGIMDEGDLTLQPESYRLLDFRARKTVAGLLLLPITRHHSLHLNESRMLKKKLTARKGKA